jgi:2-dehydropantoate 2-reductase
MFCFNAESSSLQSLEHGRLTEVDYFNGYVAKNSLKYGINALVNKTITAIIHEIEMKKRPITVDNFNDPVFNRFN